MLVVILNPGMFVTHHSEIFYLARDADLCLFALTKETLFANSLIFFSGGKHKAPKQLSIFLSKLKLPCFILINDANEGWGLVQVCNSSFHYTVVFHYFLLRHVHAFKHTLLGSQLYHSIVFGTIYLESE